MHSYFLVSDEHRSIKQAKIRIRIQAGFLYLGHQWNIWHKNYIYKKEDLPNTLKIQSMVYWISFTGQDLKPRIRKPDTHHCVIDRVLLDIRPFFISGIRPDIWFKLPDNRISGRISGLAVAEMMRSSNEQIFFRTFSISKQRYVRISYKTFLINWHLVTLGVLVIYMQK